EAAEALVYVVDVQVEPWPACRRRVPGIALRERHLDAASRQDRTASGAAIFPFLQHGPAEHVAIEREGLREIAGDDPEVIETVAAVAHVKGIEICLRLSCASTTATAGMLMMRRTVALGVRMCTGRAAPSRIGPMVMPAPPTTFRRLKEMLAASIPGIISRLASPFSRELGKLALRTSSDSAESACISPSTSRSGNWARMIDSASRIFNAEGASLEPKLECETSATFGVRPNRRTSSAASVVISTICSGVGSTLT